MLRLIEPLNRGSAAVLIAELVRSDAPKVLPGAEFRFRTCLGDGRATRTGSTPEILRALGHLLTGRPRHVLACRATLSDLLRLTEAQRGTRGRSLELVERRPQETVTETIFGTGTPGLGVQDLRARLLALPIFYKVLIANSMIVVLGAVAGSSLTLALSDYIDPAGRIELIAFFACLGTLLSVGVNFAVLKAALSPLVQLERTVDEVRTGNLTARARRNPYADPHIDKLTDTLNDMLDSIDRYRARLQALSAQVLLAQEEERKRVARELHDSTGQLLTGLLLRLKGLENASDPEVRRVADELLVIAAQTLEEVRRTAVELRPPALDDLGLVAALESHIGGYAASTGIKSRFVADGVVGRLPPEVELVLYRVVQEGLTNTARHSKARHVSVLLRYTSNSVGLTIEDDGQGFDVGQMLASREHGLGLFGMRERLSLIGGTFGIESSAGVRITASIPLPASLLRVEA